MSNSSAAIYANKTKFEILDFCLAQEGNKKVIDTHTQTDKHIYTHSHTQATELCMNF